MGSSQSSRWREHAKKTVVEDCLALELKTIVAVIGPVDDPVVERSRVFWFDARSQQSANLVVDVVREDETVILVLHYTLPDPDRPVRDVSLRIALSAGVANFGGLRWWFLCPGCQQRAGKLYLPPRECDFACRGCHDLVYLSAQTAHAHDHADALIGNRGPRAAFAKSDRLKERIDRCQRRRATWSRLVVRYVAANEAIQQLLDQGDRAFRAKAERF